MLSYRLYFLDPQSARIQDFREFEAEHDAAALEIAESLRGGGPMELWCRTRKVKKWPALFVPPSKESA